MHPDTMRLLDKLIGIPLCFVNSLWLFLKKKNQIKFPPDLILFIGIAEIGALFVAYPAINYVRNHFPKSRVCFITSPEGKNALEMMDFLNKDIFIIRTKSIFLIIHDILRTILKFRRLSVSAIVLEPFVRFSTLLSSFLGAQQRIGFYRFRNEGLYLGNILTHKVIYNPHLHASQAYMSLVYSITQNSSNEPKCKDFVPDQKKNRFKFKFEQKKTILIERKLKKLLPKNRLKKTILINPNSSDIVPLRRWPLKNFIDLCELYLLDQNNTIILTGNSLEYEKCEFIKKNLKINRVLNLAGKSSFEELFYLYNFGNLLITNDSGPVHFASTTNIPIIALYGPETPKIFGPLSPFAKVIYLDLACSPCVSVYNQKSSTCKDNRCMKNITVEMVYNKSRKHIS